MNRAYISSGVIQPVLHQGNLQWQKQSNEYAASSNGFEPFSIYLHISLFSTQVIQTVSAVDKDDPIQGHYFDYRLVPEMLNNPNFTIKNNQGERLKKTQAETFLWCND